MIYGFETDDQHAATAALIVYVVWRSRDRQRVKITPDIWGQVERWTKDASKRARSLPELIEALKRPGRICAGALHPRFMEVGLGGEAPLTYVVGEDGRLREAIQFAADRETGRREFMTRVLERTDAAAVIRAAHRETTWVIMLVRDRIERERPIEQQLDDLIDRETDQ
jgi:hypothetical protein